MLARPVLCYGSKAWTLRRSDETTMTACEMKFMHRIAGCTMWDYRKNDDILEELKMVPIINYIHQYQQNRYQHVNRMSRSRIPRAIANYQPNGKKYLGQPRMRWKENFV